MRVPSSSGPNCQNWSKFSNIVKNCRSWSKLSILVKIVKSRAIWLTFCRLRLSNWVKIVKLGQKNDVKTHVNYKILSTLLKKFLLLDSQNVWKNSSIGCKLVLQPFALQDGRGLSDEICAHRHVNCRS